MIDHHQIQETLRRAPPGTIVEAIIRFVLPGAPTEPDPQEGQEPGLPLQLRSIVATDPARRSPLERARDVGEAAGADARKESEWAADVCRATDFPARELERACQADAIAWEPKTYGKDAGARMITARALESYLAERERVQRGDAPEPEWWVEVVSPRHRRAA